MVLTGFGRPKKRISKPFGPSKWWFSTWKNNENHLWFSTIFLCKRSASSHGKLAQWLVSTVWYPGPFGPFRVVLTPCFSQCRSCALLTCIWLSPAIGLLLGQLVLSRGFVEAYGEGEGCWRQALGRKNGKSMKILNTSLFWGLPWSWVVGKSLKDWHGTVLRHEFGANGRNLTTTSPQMRIRKECSIVPRMACFRHVHCSNLHSGWLVRFFRPAMFPCFFCSLLGPDSSIEDLPGCHRVGSGVCQRFPCQQQLGVMNRC